MSELADLKQQLVDLTRERAALVASAQRTIEEANRAYDDKALEIHRKIRKLEPEPVRPMYDEPARVIGKPPKKPKAVKFSLDGMEDWTPEEIEHYKQLKGVTS